MRNRLDYIKIILIVMLSLSKHGRINNRLRQAQADNLRIKVPFYFSAFL